MRRRRGSKSSESASVKARITPRIPSPLAGKERGRGSPAVPSCPPPDPPPRAGGGVRRASRRFLGRLGSDDETALSGRDADGLVVLDLAREQLLGERVLQLL